MSQQTFALDNAWRLVLKDLGFDADELLRRAKLPGDLFVREGTRLQADDYFRLWTCFDEMAGDPEIAIKIGSMISVEHFSPPIFAALCSSNLAQAVERLCHFKKLIGPMSLDVDHGPGSMSVTYNFLPPITKPPGLLVAIELVFLVRLARLATREELRPRKVTSTFALSSTKAFTEFFGVEPEAGSSDTLEFSAQDAARPFLTANKKMWDFFEPELRACLSELDQAATMSERVKGALLELLPGGQVSIAQVSKLLRVSTRTLQRRLKEEETSFQQLLNNCREQLARHYLKNSSMSGAEISFLLGFDEPNSFFRAFHHWTGQTPERVRASLQHPN